MKNISLGVVLFVLVSISQFEPLFVSAQEASCGNIVGEYYGEPYSTPIEDCENPFGSVNLNPTLEVSYAGTDIEDGGAYELLGSDGMFVLAGTHPLAFDIWYEIYLHEGEDFREMGGGGMTDSFTFTATGTYSLVLYEYGELILTQNVFERLLATIIPTAHAFPGISRVITFEVALSEPEPTGASSVLFLPGMQASRLYKEGLLGTEDQLWEPNFNQDVYQIRMDESGESVENIYTRDILDEIYGVTNIYQGFTDFLTGLQSDAVIADWQPYAYDWRYSATDIAEEGTQYENEMRDAVALIENLQADSFSGKVTIIAHSNGGLVTKALMVRLEREGKSDLIDRIIFIGTPQLGTPKAIASVLHGFEQQSKFGIIINPETVREATRNMSGAFGLIPSAKYFDVSSEPLITFDTKSSTAFFRNAYGNSIDSQSELLDFMTGEVDGREDNPDELHDAITVNRPLLDEAFTDHALLDNWIAPEGVEVIEIVGVGLNTLRGIEYRQFTERTCTSSGPLGSQVCTYEEIYKPFPLFTQYGDATVVMQSAEAYEGEKEVSYVNLRAISEDNRSNAVSHADITENTSIHDFVKDTINGTSSVIDFVSPDRPTANEDWLLYGVHSPVSLSVTDSSGNKVERGNDRYPVEEVEGSEYLELGGSKYVLVPKNGTYSVRMQGTGFGGATFTLDALGGNTHESLVSVYVATITPSTTIDAAYRSSALTNLLIDQNGDGATDVEMTPTGELVEAKVTYADLKIGIQNLSLSLVHKKVLLALHLVAEELHKRAVKNPKLKPLEMLALKELETTLRLYVKKRLLTQAQIDPLLKIIGKLRV